MKIKALLRKILASNPMLAGLSFLLAVAIWLGITVSFAPLEQRVFPRVPIIIDSAMEAGDLEAFIPTDGLFVDVTVEGKRYVLNEMSAEQITVRAGAPITGTAGVRSLRLSASNSSRSDFQILELSQTEVNVLFDERREHEFQLEPAIVGEDGKPLRNKDVAPDGYVVDHELLSTYTVTLTGPASEIARVSSVTATAQLGEQITDTRAFIAALAIQTRDNTPLNFVSIQSDNEIIMTIPVYKRVRLPVDVEWLNAPPAYIQAPLSFTATPRRVDFGISESILDDVSVVTVGTIDFASLSAGKKTKFTFPAAEIRQHRLLGNVENFVITVDTTNKTSGKFAVVHQNIQMLGAAEGVTVQVAAGALDEVEVVGSSRSIRALEGTDLFAEADLTGIQPSENSISVPVRVFVKGYDDCWVFGEYKISITLTK
ncbi:MAG: CdaR family protein [Oscillospiraceae bacterium]|nr:CdaR family protein [Oscillospiraceae bacterium]